jgi:hypothetical protein
MREPKRRGSSTAGPRLLYVTELTLKNMADFFDLFCGQTHIQCLQRVHYLLWFFRARNEGIDRINR